MFQRFYHEIAQSPLHPWLEYVPAPLNHWLRAGRKGSQKQLFGLLDNLPQTTVSEIDLARMKIGAADDLTAGQAAQLKNLLGKFKPWRKGPYTLHGIQIETEWRSDWKWERVVPHIQDLTGRCVLDVGCGNGYHLWRMREAGAQWVLGVDPYLLFVLQFQAIQHFCQEPRLHCLPLGVDDLPPLALFDTVFSMGVLYHRRSPLDFLKQLHSQLRPGGELVLETLVIEGDVQSVLMPEERYARMRNVWFIPSVEALSVWLRRCGFTAIRCVDLNRTSLQEQCQTDWMDSESLAQALHPENPALTVEGHPAPLRATLVAQKIT